MKGQVVLVFSALVLCWPWANCHLTLSSVTLSRNDCAGNTAYWRLFHSSSYKTNLVKGFYKMRNYRARAVGDEMGRRYIHKVIKAYESNPGLLFELPDWATKVIQVMSKSKVPAEPLINEMNRFKTSVVDLDKTLKMQEGSAEWQTSLRGTCGSEKGPSNPSMSYARVRNIAYQMAFDYNKYRLYLLRVDKAFYSRLNRQYLRFTRAVTKQLIWQTMLECYIKRSMEAFKGQCDKLKNY